MNPQNSPNLFATAGGADSGSGGTASSGTIAEAKTKIAQTARDATSKVKAAAADTAHKAKDEAQRLVSEQRETTANRIGGFSSAIHDSASAMEEKDPNIAWITHQAADKLQGVADYVRTRDLDGLRSDVQKIARRHPAAFFGGMFLTGLILGNVMKASRRKLDGSGDGMDSDSNESLNAGDSMGEAGSSSLQSNMPADLSSSERNAAGI